MMSDDQNPDFITLMRSELNGALANLKVDLIDRFASKKEHDADIELLASRMNDHEKEVAVRLDSMSNRVGSLEQSRAGISALSTWQRWAIGGLLFATVNATVYAFLYHFFH